MTLDQFIENLRACLCELLEDSDRPVCFCGLLPGTAVIHEYVGLSTCRSGRDGMAFVQLVNSYPSTSVGVPNSQPGITSYSSDIQVATLRKYPIPRDGKPPTVEKQAELAAQQYEDRRTMLTAITCCEANRSMRSGMVVGAYTPYGPVGDVIGGSWSLTVGL